MNASEPLYTVAAHGISLTVPGSWDLVAMRGHPRAGSLLFIEHLQPAVSLSWSRSNRRPDLEATLKRLDKTLWRELRAAPGQLEGARDGLLRGWTTEAGQRYHALALEPQPGSGLALVLRQLREGQAGELRKLADALRIHPPDGLQSWRFYGLAADLEPDWELQGIAHYVGLARAVWIRKSSQGEDEAVLMLRRYACADRILEGSGPAQWVRSRLGPSQRVVTCLDEADGRSGSVEILVPAAGWWRRLRGLTRRRRIDTWIDENGRLVVQEWTGAGEPPPVQNAQTISLARRA